MLVNKKKLLKQLQQDVKKLENQLEYRHLYNIRNCIIRALLKVGIGFDYALPFIISSFIVLGNQKDKGNIPYEINEIKVEASIETMSTSTGIKDKKISLDYSYDKETLQHSTGWIKNESGLYERVVTTYQLVDYLAVFDEDRILSMNKQDIEESFDIIDIQRIQKNVLSPEDEFYKDDMVIITSNYTDPTNSIVRYETEDEYFSGTLGYIFSSLFLGMAIKFLYRKKILKNQLEQVEPNFKIIRKKQLESLKKILLTKKENLEMLTTDYEYISNEEKGYSYKLK